MKIFISWSGERSKALAESLREWLPLVLHYAVPWLSESDIEAGERWGDAVAQELEASNFGIICITRDNVDAPWILFEAGALAKSVQRSRVVPLLLDLEFSDISGPIGQFQAKKVEKAGLEEVVRSINQAAAESDPEPRMRQLFDALWPQLEEKIAAIPEQAGSARRVRQQSEVLEELVGSVRALDVRLRELPESGDPSRHRRPGMLMEEMDFLSRRLARGPGDPIRLLFAASAARDEAPWFSELALEAYRHMTQGDRDAALGSLERLREALEFAGRIRPWDSVEPGFLAYLIDDLLATPPGFERPAPKRRQRRPQVQTAEEENE